MTKNPVFKGVGTALITPFNEHGVDYDAFGRIIDWQIEEGINALIIAGTSGEGSTLSDEEHKKVLEFAIKRADRRVPIVAGTGSNDAAYAVQLSKFACDAGADALLVVTPYYNKAMQNGLIELYNLIADSVTKPIIVYNVPSRTGVNVLPETCAVLSKHENIVGIKEASGNITQIMKTASLVKGNMDIYSGDDDQIVPIMAVGGIGVISVISNILPKKTVEICDRFFAGDLEGSRELQFELLPLMGALFSEVNPIPVKAAMAAMGFCENRVRLPLTPLQKPNEEVLLKLMREQGLIK